MYIFLTIVITITLLIHWFLYARLVSALEITSPAMLWTLRALALFLSQSYILARILERSFGGIAMHALEWTASVWIAIWWQLLWMTLLLFIIKVILLATGIWMNFSGEQQFMIGRYSVYAVVSIALLLNIYGYNRAASPARIVEVKVPVENPTPEVQGMKIAMVADFHASRLMHSKRVADYCDQISALNPELILIPGDIIDTPPQHIPHMVEAFKRLRAKRGVFATTGNHEYYAGLNGAMELIKQSGMKLLMNQAVELRDGIYIAGIEDRTAKSMGRELPPVNKILHGKEEGKTKILLNHTPAAGDMEEAIKGGADLVVCGHTHGGQIWPFSLLTKWAFPLHHGLYPVGDGYVLTTSGIGFWGPPVRIGAPPEIMLIRFVPKNEKAEVKW
ncbi:metallophosphoesterase [bacterium]|nr:MAG: metallophosphoesterase [bacterium]